MNKKFFALLILAALLIGCSRSGNSSDAAEYLEDDINLEREPVPVPFNLASKLFIELIEYRYIDTAEVSAEWKKNPAVIFKAESADLNNDKIPELLIYLSDPAAPHISVKHPLWFFKKSGNDFEELFYVHGTAGFKFLDHKSAGFYDMVLIKESSEAEKEYKLHKFDGYRYQQMNCYTVKSNSGSYTYNEHECITEVEEHTMLEHSFTGYFKEFETGDYIHAVFTNDNSPDRSFWLPADESIYKILSKNKNEKFEVIYKEEAEYIPEAGDTMVIETIQSVKKINK